MATLTASDRITALEVANRDQVSDDARRIIEQMAVTNEILLDAPAVQANDKVVNTSVVRTAVPHGTHRIYNQGVLMAASQTKVIHDVVCQTAIYSKVDASLVDNSDNPQSFLMNECAAFIQGMGDDQADDIVYGNHTADKSNMDGFAIRRPKLDGTLCIGMGGSSAGAMSSVYLVKWGQATCHYIYPRGSKTIGVMRTDKGVQTVDDDVNGGQFEAYVNYFQCDYGLAVRNEKSIVRLCNIDTSTIDAKTLIMQILKAKRNLCKGDGTIAIYANSTILGLMDAATVEKDNVVYNAEDPWGRELTKIRDMRLRQVDALLDTEDVVTA